MDNFTSLYPVTTEGACFYDYNSVVTCAGNEGLYIPPPPSYEQTTTTSTLPWLLSEMTEVQNSILPQEDCEPHIELSTLDFDVNLLQVATSQNIEFNIANPISYEDISHLNHQQSELSYVTPTTPPLRRSPRLARKKKMTENILQLPPDLLFLEDATPTSNTCLPRDLMQMQIPFKNQPNSLDYLESGVNNSQYLSGNLDAAISTLAPLSAYSSPTHLTTSPVNISPQQTHQQNYGYNTQVVAYSSPSHFTASSSGTCPQQTNHHNSGYSASYSSPSHLITSSSTTSPLQTNLQGSGYNTTYAYSSPTQLSSSSGKIPQQTNIQGSEYNSSFVTHSSPTKLTSPISTRSQQTHLQDGKYDDSITRYTSLTNLTASSSSRSPLQTNLQDNRYNDTLPRYTSLTNLTAPSTSTSPQQLDYHRRGYNAPLPTYSSPPHHTTSPLSISPHQENHQSGSFNATILPEQCSPLPKFSTIKPPPSYPTTFLPPPSYPAITKQPPSYPKVERMLPQRKSVDNISQILTSPQISDDDMNTFLPSSSDVASSSTSSTVNQNISEANIQMQSSTSIKESGEVKASRRTRTKRLPRASYDAMSENERSQHNRTLSQQRCVRYRDNKKISIKKMEKEIDLLEDKKKQLKNKFEALKLTKQKVEQLMPAFLRSS